MFLKYNFIYRWVDDWYSGEPYSDVPILGTGKTGPTIAHVTQLTDAQPRCYSSASCRKQLLIAQYKYKNIENFTPEAQLNV